MGVWGRQVSLFVPRETGLGWIYVVWVVYMWFGDNSSCLLDSGTQRICGE